MPGRAADMRRRTHSGRSVNIPSHVYPYATAILDEALPLIAERIRIKRARKETPVPVDPVEWMEARFYTPDDGLIKLAPHQKVITKLVCTRDSDGYFPYRTVIYSTIKKSGKSTWAGAVLRWYAETQRRNQELLTLGNDMEQAKLRSFREIRTSISETPGYNSNRDVLPGEWICQKLTMRCLLTGSEIRAVAVDAKGEAGGRPALQCWTELWGFEQEDALRFWDELTPVPTVPDSFRIVETYAGYEGESHLLQQQYDLGKAGRQLTEGEVRARTGIANAFHEAPNEDDLVPLWENETASLFMYWDEGLTARRMPWQQGKRGDEYYRSQEKSLTPNAFARLHRNEWTSSVTGFVPIDQWDACEEELPALLPGDRTPLIVGVDAATTGDCFAIVAVSRHPLRHDEVAVRRVRVWDPKEQGGKVNYADPETFLRTIAQGACTGPGRHPKSKPSTDCEACVQKDYVPGFNVIQIAYDPYQLVDMMQRLSTDRVAWCEPFLQGADRLMADKQLYDLIMARRLAHKGDPVLRQHVINAGAKVTQEDTKLRIVKKSEAAKIDATVATSMAVAVCLELILPKTKTPDAT